MPSTPVSTGHRQRQIADEIAALGPCLPGSLVQRTTRCGSSRCRCPSDPSHPHGPYPTRIPKVGTKTVTPTLRPPQREQDPPPLDKPKPLRQLTTQAKAP